MKKFVTVGEPVFTDPWDREKEYPILPGELCILCEDDHNKDKNEYVTVIDVNPDPNVKGDAFFTVEKFSRDGKDKAIERVKQKDLLFIPWKEESETEYDNFIKSHINIVQWVEKIRRIRLEN